MENTMSFKQKIFYLQGMCFNICYGNIYKFKDRLDADEAWCICDGIYYEYIVNKINGKCSLADILSFDMEKEEKITDDLIAYYEGIFINELRIDPVLLVDLQKDALSGNSDFY